MNLIQKQTSVAYYLPQTHKMYVSTLLNDFLIFEI